MERTRLIDSSDGAEQADDEMPAGGRNQAEQNNRPRRTPKVPHPPKAAQDTRAVEGEHVLNPPEGTELVQRSKLQG